MHRLGEAVVCSGGVRRRIVHARPSGLHTLMLWGKLCGLALLLAAPQHDLRRAVFVGAGLVALALFGVIGGIIGEAKNRADAGTCYSLLLGPLGWFLTDLALAPHCHACDRAVEADAPQCPHCRAELFAEESTLEP